MAVQHLLRSRPTQAFTRLFVVLTLLLIAIAGAAPGSALAAGPTPVALEFDGTDNATVLNSFLTTSLSGTNVPNGNATVNTAGTGTLNIVSSAGDLPPFSTGQDNALAITYASQGSYTIGARLLKPVFAGPFQSAGIYIGKHNSDPSQPIQYIRFTVGRGSKNSTGERLELDVREINGKLRSSVIPLPAGTLASINTSLDLFLNIDHTGSGKLTALYRIDSDNANAGRLATSRNFPRWLRQGGSVSVDAGVITTNRGTPAPITISYDWFRLTADAQAVASVSGTKIVDRDGISGPAVNPGDTLTYTISILNNGTATNVQVADPIPVDTTYVVGSVNTLPPTVPAATFDATNNQIVWQNAAFAAGGQVTITYQVKINAAPLQSSTIVNTAELTYGASTTPAFLIASTTVGVTPDLSDSIYGASPSAVSPNGTVTYTLNLLNDGTAPANGATAQLSIPSGTALVPNSASASSGSLNIDPSLTTLTWSAAGPLAVDSTVTISFAVNVGSGLTNGTTLFSRAILQATGTLPNIVTAQAIYTVASAVGGIKTVDKAQATPGAPLNYLITVTNTSDATVNNLRVVDPIPQDTTYNGNLSATPGAGTPSYSTNPNQITWDIPSLAAGQSVNMSFQVLINSLQMLFHSAVITNQAMLTVPGARDSLLSASTIVDGVADLSHSIYTANPASVAPNGTIVYTLDLLSDGTTAATNATAELTIPAGVTLVANSAAATSGNLNVNTGLNKINWTAGGPLPIGSVTRISFQAKLDGTGNGPFTSTATMQATGTALNSLTAQAHLVQSSPSGKIIYLSIIVR